jgi:hypothetical protein
MLTMGIPIVMAIAGAGVLIYVLSSAQIDDPVTFPFLLAWIGFVGFLAYQMLRMPSVIEWHGDGTVSFLGPARTLRVSISGIQSIRPGGNGLGFLEIRFAGGKLNLLNQFQGFHDFLSRLKIENPDIELRGC